MGRDTHKASEDPSFVPMSRRRVIGSLNCLLAAEYLQSQQYRLAADLFGRWVVMVVMVVVVVAWMWMWIYWCMCEYIFVYPCDQARVFIRTCVRVSYSRLACRLESHLNLNE